MIIKSIKLQLRPLVFRLEIKFYNMMCKVFKRVKKAIGRNKRKESQNRKRYYYH